MTEGDNLLYNFGFYSLDVRERVLTREGCVVPLTPKAFDTLLVLVRNSGHVVQKDDLMKEVWPDAFVEEANLTQNIFGLRRALGENTAEPQYIETVPRRGYRFVAPVQTISKVAPEASAKRKTDPANARSLRTIAVLAVLPFVNEREESKMEFLADGITDRIINSLSELPKLRVMSRSAVFRYKGMGFDAKRIGKELGVDALLMGRVQSLEGRLLVSAELVDTTNGWHLWGENYNQELPVIPDFQDEIANLIATALRQRLVGDDEQHLTKRYSGNAAAYEAYLKARHYWSMFTREGLERATKHFEEAITLDPNYAFAYAGIIDCYLRLATNYIPPAHASPTTRELKGGIADERYETPTSLKIRDAWDQKTAERETKRAIELRANYPAAHQWYAAYLFSKRLYDEAVGGESEQPALAVAAKNDRGLRIDAALLSQIQSSRPTPAEEIQIFCMIAREQIEVGNYEGACAVLQRWWSVGEWPRLESLSPASSADLLLTAGTLAGWVASASQVPRGYKHAEELLNGAIAIFEQIGAKVCSAEGRIELSGCYYREGMFDLACSTGELALEILLAEDLELRSVGQVRLSTIECRAGRPHDALKRLDDAAEFVEFAGPWATGRYHLELATTLKKLATTEMRPEYFDRAADHYRNALYEFEAAGDHRHSATVENNYGFLLLTLNRFEEAETHLGRARMLFEGFADTVRSAQVDDTLARLHINARRFDLAEQSTLRAIETLEIGGDQALLAEALTTHGIVLCRLNRHREAKRILDRANRVAESCGDTEAAGCALVIMIEEMCEQLEDDERLELGARMSRLLAHSQQASILERLRKCLDAITRAHENNKLTIRTLKGS